MIKTFLRRWWVLNQLFHFSKHQHDMWATREYFLQWMRGENLTDRFPAWYTGITQVGAVRQWWTRRLYNSTSSKKPILHDAQIRELGGIVDECEQQGLIKPSGGSSIKLTDKGLEQYSVTYLLFGHYYAKTIWTGLLVGGFLLWFGAIVKNAFPDKPLKVQMEYIPVQTQGGILIPNGQRTEQVFPITP